MSRQKLIQSLGATCDNWQWSWSFINHQKKFVIFGAWEHLEENGLQMIFSDEWTTNAKGRKTSGFEQSMRHLDYIQEEEYNLLTFPMEAVDGTQHKSEIPVMKKINPQKTKVTKKRLITSGPNYFASAFNCDNSPTNTTPKKNREALIEGEPLTIKQNRYERNSIARQECLNHFGCGCSVCGFEFGAGFGELGKGFIHVHHLIPISKRKKKYIVDPINDLRPVCPNCHAMIHKRCPPYNIEELQSLMKKVDK